MTSEEIFLKFSAEKLEQMRSRIQDCLGRLTPEQVWTRNSDNENAVGNLVLHLCGNVRQWIGSGVAGLPDSRERDAEFEARGSVAPEILSELLKTRVDEAAETIRFVPSARLDRAHLTAGLRCHGARSAIAHVVEHFSHHTGQVILLTKLQTGQDLGYYQHLRGSGRAAGARLP